MKKTTILKTIAIISCAILTGYYGWYTGANSNSQPKYFIPTFPAETALITIQNGTWTATLFDGWGTTFQSDNMSEVVQWAMNMTGGVGVFADTNSIPDIATVTNVTLHLNNGK